MGVAGGRTGLRRNSGSKGLDGAPGAGCIVVGLVGYVGEERDYTSRIKLDERCDTSDVRRFWVLGCRRTESTCGVLLNIDDVCSGKVIGDKSEFLLNAGRLEEGSGLSMGSREDLVARVTLNIRLEEGDWMYMRTPSPTLAKRTYNE